MPIAAEYEYRQTDTNPQRIDSVDLGEIIPGQELIYTPHNNYVKFIISCNREDDGGEVFLADLSDEATVRGSIPFTAKRYHKVEENDYKEVVVYTTNPHFDFTYEDAIKVTHTRTLPKEGYSPSFEF